MSEISGRPLSAITAVVLLVFALIHQVYLTQTHPDALYMDSLRLLHQLQEWEQGRMTLSELWGQGSVHRGLINQMALWANVNWLSLDVMLVNRLTGFAMLGIASILSSVAFCAWRREHTAFGFWVGVSLLVLIPVLVFSWSGFELFTLDLGLPLWLKNLFVVAYFAIHARFLQKIIEESPVSAWWSWSLLCFGFLMVLFITMGWSYAFVGTVVGIYLLALLVINKRVRFRLMRELGVTLGLLAALFVFLSEGGGVGDGVSTAAVVGRLPQVVALVPYSLGSSWIGVEAAAHWHISLTWIYVLGLLSLVSASVGLLGRIRRGVSSAPMLPLYLLAYGSLSAFSVCVARGELGPEYVMASRYYMDFMLFQVGAFWLFAEHAKERLKHDAPSSAFAYGIVWLLAIGMQGLVFRNEWLTAPYRKAAFEAMNEATLAGVPDDAAARLLQSPLQHARLGAGVMRSRSLGVFAHAPAIRDCDISSLTFISGWHGSEQTGRWMSGAGTLSVPGCACELLLTSYVPKSFGLRTLRIDDPAELGQSEIVVSAGATVSISLPGASKSRKVTLSLDRTTIPARDLVGGIDRRELGAYFSSPSFVCGNVVRAIGVE